MTLIDIGNRNAHVLSNDEKVVLPIDEAIDRFRTKSVFYISVNSSYTDKLDSLDSWVDISQYISIDGEYQGLGIDRKAMALSRGDGIYIDAGSAITIERVVNNRYDGGIILPGIYAYSRAYSSISPILDIELNREIDPAILPKNTTDSVSYGTIVPIIAIIASMADELNLYFTGADGEWLSKYFAGAIYSDELVFEGMQKAILESDITLSPNQ